MTRLRYLLGSGAIVLAALSTAPAMATTADLGVIAPGMERGIVLGHYPPGHFMDQISFTTTQSGNNAMIGYFNFFVQTRTVTSNITNAMLSLVGPTTYNTALGNGEMTLALAAGNYTANISGDASGRNGGAYNFTVAAPTPEPVAWMSLIAGVGMAGFAARRRRRTTLAIS